MESNSKNYKNFIKILFRGDNSIRNYLLNYLFNLFAALR